MTKDNNSGWGSGQVNGTDSGWGGSSGQDSSTWNGDGGKSRTFNSVTFTARGASRGGGGRGGFGRKSFGEFVWFYNHCTLFDKELKILLSHPLRAVSGWEGTVTLLVVVLVIDSQNLQVIVAAEARTVRSRLSLDLEEEDLEEGVAEVTLPCYLGTFVEVEEHTCPTH